MGQFKHLKIGANRASSYALFELSTLDLVLREFAVMVQVMWPAVPMSLILLHLFIGFWRRVGRPSYLILFFLWVPIGYVLSLHSDALLWMGFPESLAVRAVGLALIVLAVVLHAWTADLLGLKATLGLAELDPVDVKRPLVTSGPFGVVRHPSYLAHTMFLLGTFLVAGYLAIGVIVVLDLLLTYFVTIPLEERELLKRYGAEYQAYRKTVPKLLPTRL